MKAMSPWQAASFLWALETVHRPPCSTKHGGSWDCADTSPDDHWSPLHSTEIFASKRQLLSGIVCCMKWHLLQDFLSLSPDFEILRSCTEARFGSGLKSTTRQEAEASCFAAYLHKAQGTKNCTYVVCGHACTCV